jgi:hypothetical protein
LLQLLALLKRLVCMWSAAAAGVAHSGVVVVAAAGVVVDGADVCRPQTVGDQHVTRLSIFLLTFGPTTFLPFPFP